MDPSEDEMLSKWTSHDGISAPPTNRKISGSHGCIRVLRLLIVSSNIGHSMGYNNILKLPMWLVSSVKTEMQEADYFDEMSLRKTLT